MILLLKKNIQDYNLNYYSTYDNKPITFDCFFINEHEDSHMTQLIVKASFNGEMAGYISLLYLSEENKNKYFSNVIDYYFNKKISKYFKDLYQQDFHKFCLEFNHIYNTSINNKSEFNEYIEKQTTNDYIKFISFYLNKPYPEIVAVYSEQDLKSKDFSEFPFMSNPRKLTNFLGKGIGTSLYHASCVILKKENLELYASNNQTEDGQRMWRHLSQNSKFITLSDTYLTSLTQDRNNVIEMKRKKITI